MLFNQTERDRDFLLACEKIQARDKSLSATEIATKAVYSECSFYLSVKECARIIRTIQTGKGFKALYKATEEQRDEIKKRYLTIQSTRNGITAAEIARIICEQKAPRFYLSESRAIRLYYELMKPEKRIEILKSMPE